MARILIVTPDLKLLGGVALFYKGILPYLSDDVSYLQMKEVSKKHPFSYLFFNVLNITRYVLALLFNAPAITVLNSSLKEGFYSNIVFCILTQLLKKRYIVFIHGWDENSEHYLSTKRGYNYLSKAEAIFVLSSSFKDKLVSHGFDGNRIYVNTTEVDDNLVRGFDINRRSGQIKNFLFLARAVREKGLFESIDIFSLLSKDYPDIVYNVVGDGKDLEEARNYVNNNKIERVYFYGRKEGDELVNFYTEADFFFFLSYTEGMPASLLEAMAFGLMIATRPVGAIPEVFCDGVNGILSQELSPEYYYDRIKYYMDNPDKVKAIEIYNHNYSKEKFLASSVAKRFEIMIKRHATT